jgi:hypothetical protein
MVLAFLIAGYTFDVRPIAALSRNLDCLSGTTKCALDAYKDLWKKEMGGISSDDDARLAVWRAAEEEDERVEWKFEDAPVQTRFPLRHSDPTLFNKVHIAALQAASIDDYRSRLELLVSARAAETRVGVIAHFLPRYEKYFTTAKTDLERFSKAAADVIEKKKLSELIDKAAAFYGADLPPAHKMHFVLIPRPVAKSRRTNAQQFDNYSVIEVPFGDAPEERLDVVFHEMFHYFYQSALAERHAAIANAFSAMRGQNVFNAYSLMDEGLATAFGNGLVAQRLLEPDVFKKRLDTKQSFYLDDLIDPVAKAIMPLLEEAKSLDVKFATHTYLDAVERILGPELATVRAGLRTFVLAYDSGSNAALRRKLLEAANAASMQSLTPITETQTLWEFYQHLDENGVLLLVGRDLQKIDGCEKFFGKDLVARLKKLGNDQTVFAYGIARSPKAKTYVLYGATAQQLEAFLPKFLAQKTPFDGPLLADQ